MRRLKDQLRNRLRVSVAEVGAQDLWQRTELGVAVVSPDQSTARQVLEAAAAWLDSQAEVEMTDRNLQVEAWS